MEAIVRSAGFSNKRKAGYASVETGVTAFELMLQFYLLEFYINACGLHPILASGGAAVAVLWDAISDPLIGHWSDQSKSKKFGRRIPFILSGSFLLGLSGYAIFNPPQWSEQLPLLAWFLISYLAVNTSMTLVSVPHIACVGDFAKTGSERNSFFGWRLLFSNIGLLVGVTLPSLLSGDTESWDGRKNSAAIFAGILIINACICTFSIFGKKPFHHSNAATNSLKTIYRTIGAAFKNPYFLPLLVAFGFTSIARALNSGFALFYYKDHLVLDERTQVSLILLVFIFAIIVSIPIWLLLSKKFWKREPALFGVFSIGIMTCLTYPFFPPGSITGPLFMAIFGGIAVGSILLIESLVLDTVDFDELRSGKRRDGAYFGCWKMTAKASRAVGIAFTGPLLIWTGYDQELSTQSFVTQERISWIFGFGVGFFFLLGAWMFRYFRMTKLKHQDILERIEKRNRNRLVS